jgi:prefoldin subunit 5
MLINNLFTPINITLAFFVLVSLGSFYTLTGYVHEYFNTVNKLHESIQDLNNNIFQIFNKLDTINDKLDLLITKQSRESIISSIHRSQTLEGVLRFVSP